VEGEASRPSDRHDATYNGPVIAASGWADHEGWVWVANGTCSVGEVFASPRPLVTRAPLLWASIPTDDASVDSVIQSFQDESWGLEDDELDNEGPDVDTEDSVDLMAVRPSSLPVASEAETPPAAVRVLGPVEVAGWREAPQRAIVTELACYLGIHIDRAISGEELRSALWPDDASEASAKSLRTYMSLLRKALGSDLLPPGTTSGYRISPKVRVDWVEFRHLVRLDASTDDLARALQLVRGRPFAGVPSHAFQWVYSELLVSEIEVAVVRAARQLVSAALETDALDLAAWAIGQGLLAVPSDIGLWELRLSIARRRGPDELRRACRDAEAVLDADAAELIQAATA
jgi:hypothetical protein